MDRVAAVRAAAPVAQDRVSYRDHRDHRGNSGRVSLCSRCPLWERASQSVRIVRFTSAEQIEKLKPTLAAYIEEAINVEKAGLKVALKKPSDFPLPDELMDDSLYQDYSHANARGAARTTAHMARQLKAEGTYSYLGRHP